MGAYARIKSAIETAADAAGSIVKVALGSSGNFVEYPEGVAGRRTWPTGQVWLGDTFPYILSAIGNEFDSLYPRVWCVGGEDWMCSSIGAAVTGINADPVPPAAGARVMILIFPGYYAMTSEITVPSWVHVKGVSKRAVQLYNNTTDMFKVSGYNWFSDFLIEGAPTTTLAAFDGDDKSNVRIARVDMLKNAGNNKQRFIWQSGANWETWLIEDCIIDWYGTGGYVNLLANTSGAARAVDVVFNNVFFDAFQLTTWGHNIGVRACKDVRIRNSTIRGNGGWHTGVRVENGGIAGSVCHVRHSYLEGGVPVFGEANTHYNLINSDAIGALTAGTRTLRNSSVV